MGASSIRAKLLKRYPTRFDIPGETEIQQAIIRIVKKFKQNTTSPNDIIRLTEN